MIQFRAFGTPKPKGSKRAFNHPATGKVVMLEQAGQALRDWMSVLNDLAQSGAEEAQADPEFFEGPLEVRIGFIMPRPKAHYRTNGEIKPSAPKWHTKMPDIDKCVRAVLDALTGALFKDDAQIACLFTSQIYESKTERPGAQIIVKKLP
jgi:Holliday junction resolvase RusA-like endonuclease